MICVRIEAADGVGFSLEALMGTTMIFLLGLVVVEPHTQCWKGPARSSSHVFIERIGFCRGDGMGVLPVHSAFHCKAATSHTLYMGHL